MKFTWIQTEKATYSVAKLCRWLDVTRSGFYAWRARQESMHTRDDRRCCAVRKLTRNAPYPQTR